MQDTRDKNIYFDFDSLETYFHEYIEQLNECLTDIDQIELLKAQCAIESTMTAGGRVFVAGNGGSSAIAEHLTCDFEKGCHTKRGSIVTHSLSSNTALLTAIGNDLGYSQIFSYQLETQKLNAADVVVLISSSGNSANITEAAQYAHSCDATIIGMTGFDGGKLKALADINLHVPFSNYGLVEDIHQTLMHILAQAIYLTKKK